MNAAIRPTTFLLLASKNSLKNYQNLPCVLHNVFHFTPDQTIMSDNSHSTLYLPECVAVIELEQAKSYLALDFEPEGMVRNGEVIVQILPFM